MAYSTGSAADLTALLDAIRVFAIAQGWTVDKWTAGSRLLFLRRGITFVTMEGSSRTFNSWETGSSVSTTEQVLRMAIGTGITTALNTYFGHPGSIVTTATDSDRIEVNDRSHRSIPLLSSVCRQRCIRSHPRCCTMFHG